MSTKTRVGPRIRVIKTKRGTTVSCSRFYHQFRVEPDLTQLNKVRVEVGSTGLPPQVKIRLLRLYFGE
jgi:hypothetical protein